MVNTGRPSRGCLTCRRRRVKCDEKRPNCSRCTKMKIDCEWQDEWSSIVRHQETWAEKRVVQRVERVQALRVLKDASQARAPIAQQYPNRVTIPKQCQIGPEYYAINHFYGHYACEVAADPFLYLLQPLLLQEQTPSSLHSVVPAVALASAAKLQNRYDLMKQADKHYGQALRELSKAIIKPSIAKHDATLLTIFMLSLFEVIAHDKHPDVLSPHKSHAPGRLALLHLRGREQLQSSDGCNLFLVMYLEHLVSCLMGKSEPMDEAPSWVYGCIPPSPITAMTMLMHDTACFLSRLRKLLGQSRKSKSAEVLLMVREGLSLDTMLSSMYSFLQSGRSRYNLALEFYASKHILWQDSTSSDGTPTSQQSTDTEDFECPQTPKKSNKPVSRGFKEDIPRIVSSWSKGGFELPEATTELGIMACAVSSNICRATHISLLTGLAYAIDVLQISRHLRKDSPEQSSSGPSSPAHHELDLGALHTEWAQTIRRHGKDICDDIPNALGLGKDKQYGNITGEGRAYRAYLMLWPLNTALVAKQTVESTKEEIRERLKFLNEKLGLGMAEYLSSENCSTD